MAGMLTHSGRLVSLDVDVGAEVTPPSIPDIGLALSRVPRFGGHTRRWWTVAHHVLWLDDLAKSRGATDDIRLAILLHDAHEAVTGDIPTHFKTPDMRSSQRDLDRAIFGRYHRRFHHVEESVKYWDRIGLLSEADVVGPPALDMTFATLDKQRETAKTLFLAHFPGLPTPDYSRFLRDWTSRNSSLLVPHATSNPTAQEFVSRVTKLL